MANYYAGHDFFLQYLADNGTPNESTGAISAPTGSWTDIGYVNPANIQSSEGTKKGFAAGSRTALYSAKGQRTHSLSADLRLGSAADLKTLCVDTPAYYALRWGIDNNWASQLRQAICSTLELKFTEGDAQEITASAVFEAVAREDGVTPPNINYNQSTFGSVLFWHNVMSFTIDGSPLRDALMGLTVNLDNKIERKGIRPDWGDDAPLSRTPYGIMVHHQEIKGTLDFHDQLAATYFTSNNDSTDWGQIVINCNDTSAGGSKSFLVTLNGVRPVSRTQEGVESSAQLKFGVEFVADTLSVALS